MLKKILTFVLSTGVFVLLSAGFNSCAPTAPNAPATTLISAPSSLTLSKADSSASSSIGLSCGCTFPLTVIGYGDTSIIHFSFAEKLDSKLTTHNLSARIIPSSLSSPGTASSWIRLSTPNDSVTPSTPGTPLYDTINVTASY
ncbi:MAG TPA: hypothetical protein VFD13_01590 [Candidatus Kapabacteria bacterium]|nr:hypothetical protein [Candidatus Kapabacteria bacterium]